jgi:hypothetical protein
LARVAARASVSVGTSRSVGGCPPAKDESGTLQRASAPGQGGASPEDFLGKPCRNGKAAPRGGFVNVFGVLLFY